jgi:anti-sigma factor RsiW
MEADGVTLTDEQVRARFSAYHEGELPPAEMAFVRQRLAQDRALATEYEQFQAMLTGLAALAQPGVPSASTDEPRVDLLAGVQQRLHTRSGGRFYRNRWSRAAGVRPLEAVAALVLLLLLLVWVGMNFVSGMRPAESDGAPESTPSSR